MEIDLTSDVSPEDHSRPAAFRRKDCAIVVALTAILSAVMGGLLGAGYTRSTYSRGPVELADTRTTDRAGVVVSDFSLANFGGRPGEIKSIRINGKDGLVTESMVPPGTLTTFSVELDCRDPGDRGVEVNFIDGDGEERGLLYSVGRQALIEQCRKVGK